MKQILFQTMAKRYKLTGVRFGGLNPIDYDPELDCPDHCCYNCHSPDHERKDCPEPSWPEPICFNCGRAGVSVAQCPRCSDAYVLYIERHNAQVRERARIDKIAVQEELERYRREREKPESVQNLMDSSIPENLLQLDPILVSPQAAPLQVVPVPTPNLPEEQTRIDPQSNFSFPRWDNKNFRCLPPGQKTAVDNIKKALENARKFPDAFNFLVHCLCVTMENAIANK